MDDRPLPQRRATAYLASRTIGRRLYLVAVVLTAGLLLGVALGSVADLPTVEVRLSLTDMVEGREETLDELPLPAELAEELTLVGNVQQALARFGGGRELSAVGGGDPAAQYWSRVLRRNLRILRKGMADRAHVRLQLAYPDPGRAAAVLQALSAWYVNQNCTEPLHAKRRAHQAALNEALAARDALAQANGDLERLEQLVRQIESQASANRADSTESQAMASSDPRAVGQVDLQSQVDPAILAAEAEKAELISAQRELEKMLETRTHEHPEVRLLTERVAELGASIQRNAAVIPAAEGSRQDAPSPTRERRTAAGMVELSSLLVDLYVRREQAQNERSRVSIVEAHAQRLEQQVRELEWRHLVVERARFAPQERLVALREGLIGSALGVTLLGALAVGHRTRLTRTPQVQRALGLEIWSTLNSDVALRSSAAAWDDRAGRWTRLSAETALVSVAIALALFAWRSTEFRHRLDAHPWQAYSYAVRYLWFWITA